MRYRLFFLTGFLLVFSMLVNAGTTGKIAGKITDKDSKEILIGATIVIEGTNLGAISDPNGDYYIINVPVGKYRVRISYIGYGPVMIEDVRATADFTTHLDIALIATTVQVNEVVIIAKRELIQKDATSTMAVIEASEIKALPVQSFTQAMVLNTGFVESKNRGSEDNGIHLRGGRSREISYVIDGVKVDDPLLGGLATDVSRVGVSSLTVLSGTFNAEYGQAQSGIINVVTQEGGSQFAGLGRIATDQFGGSKNDWQTVRQEFSLTGPLPLFDEQAKFFFSLDNLKTETYLNRVKGPEFDKKSGKKFTITNFNFGLFDNHLRMTGKLTFRLFEQAKLQFGAVISDRHYRAFDGYYKQLPQSNGQDKQNSNLYTVLLSQALDKDTFYELRYSYFEVASKHYLFDDELSGNFNNIFSPVSVSDAFDGTSNYEFAGYYGLTIPVQYAVQRGLPLWEPIISETTGDTLYRTGEIVTADMLNHLADTSFTHTEKPIVKVPVKAASHDDYFRSAKSITQTVSASFSTQLDKWNAIKLGAEYKWHRIGDSWVNGINSRWNYVEDPTDPNFMTFADRHLEAVYYLFRPVQFALYAQDKLEISDIIVNVGLRYDYLDAKAPDQYNAFYNSRPGLSTTELKTLSVPSKNHISPRVGFAFPISDKAKLHAAYGQFYQFPDFDFLYRRFNQNNPNYPIPNLGQGLITLGNPNLKPETTNAFEIGGEVIFSEDLLGSITVFYKDTYNYISAVQKRYASLIYFEFQNLDYANSRGIEFSIKKRMSSHFGYTISYTYSRAEGNADNSTTHFDEYYNESVLGIVPPKRTVTLSWDQPHTIAVNSTLSYDTWGISVVGQYGSGLPYTPTDARGSAVGETNSDRQPWTGTVDLRAYKSMAIEPATITLIADVTNLFDRKNIYRVFTSTGKPDFSLNPSLSTQALTRPEFYGPARHFELGLEVGF